MSIVSDLRSALIKSDVSLVKIEADTGIHRVNLSQFKTGARKSLPIDQLELLAKSLGLKITLESAKKKK